MKYYNLSDFSLKNVSLSMDSINPEINSEFQTPFPKARERLLSFYIYRKRYVEVSDAGYFNKARLIASLFDFTFIRSLVADAYSKEGGHCYDPVSLFLCELFRFLDAVPSMKNFCNLLNDKDLGRHYRDYAGICPPNIPCVADFSNFKVTIGEDCFNQIFQTIKNNIKFSPLYFLVFESVTYHFILFQ